MENKNYTTRTDAEIIVEVKKGDLDGIVFLYQKYQRQIRAVSKKYFLANEDSDDLFQIASIGFIKSVVSFNPDYNVSFITYARKCMNNCLIDYMRKSTSIKNMANYKHESIYDILSNDGNVNMIDTLQDESSLNPEYILLEKEANEMLDKMCDDMNLSELEKNVLCLKSQDKKQKEIAAELCIDIRSVDNALQRIKRKFTKYNS